MALTSQELLFLFPHLLGVVVTCGVGILAWRRRGVSAGGEAFAFASWGQTTWLAGYVLELTSSGVAAKGFWDGFQNLGLVAWVLGTVVFAAN